MKNESPDLLSLLRSSLFKIPLYQREYQWGPERWRDLWSDIVAVYLSGAKGAPHTSHFIGVILLELIDGVPRRKHVIDGQQRLVTLLSLYAAVLHHEIEVTGGAPTPDNTLFFPVDEATGASLGSRIEVQKRNREQFDDALGGTKWRKWYQGATKKQLKDDPILAAYTFFRMMLYWGEESIHTADMALSLPTYSVKQRNEGQKAETVWQHFLESKGIPVGNPITPSSLRICIENHLTAIVLTIGPDDQGAQAVFQNINAKRTELQEWDLVRNDLFIPLAESEARDLHDNLWSPLEKHVFGAKYRSQRSDSRDVFLYDFLVSRGERRIQGSLVKRHGYLHFRRRLQRYIEREGDRRSATIAFAKNDLLVAAQCWPMAIGEAESPTLKPQKKLSPQAQQHIQTITALSGGPSTPVVMYLLESWMQDAISEEDLISALELIEQFLIRHVIAGTSLSPLRSFMMKVMDNVVGDRREAAIEKLLRIPKSHTITEDMLRKEFLSSSGALADPTNATLKSRLQGPVYEDFGGHQLFALFRALEFRWSGAHAPKLVHGREDSDYTVEHVFPQSATKPGSDWDPDLKRWKVTNKSYAPFVHSLGNLTLMTMESNRWMGAKSLEVKRSVLTGNSEQIQLDNVPLVPVLRVNSFLGAAKRWTTAEIKARMEELVGTILRTWPPIKS